MERLRRLESWIATKTAQLLLGFRLKDPMSGYFLVWRKDFTEVKGQLNGKGFKILLEILARLRASKVKEVPYTFRPRTQGQSKLSGRLFSSTSINCGGCAAQAGTFPSDS